MRFLVGLLIAAVVVVRPPDVIAGDTSFRVHEIGQPGGNNFGQTSAVDVDKDGDLDFISGRQAGDVFWFENQGVGRWPQHLIGENALTDVGGIAFDVDGDGWIDQVSGGTWFRNPGPAGVKERWERFENGATGAHDNLAADMDGDGKLDLVSLLDAAGVFWYSIPGDPIKKWTEHKVAGVTTPRCHGGIAAGDIDGDGDTDISRADRWFENADGKGANWIEHHAFEFGKEGPWGIQTRAHLVDLDRDGDLDLIQAEGDVLDGRVAWFENRDGKAKEWSQHLIKSPGHNQDFHSLCVADFDNDGDVDVFSGGGPLTKGEFQWFIWENADGKGGSWEEHVIRRGLQTHESVCADVDGDGDIDILTKPWSGDLHLFVENQTESKLRIGVRDTKFTVNNMPVFLLGCSYYGALGCNEKTWQSDLDDLQKAGFNWIRVWATWAAYDHDVSVVDGNTGKAREQYLSKLKSLLSECDRRGIIVDVTLSRGNGATGPVRLQTYEAHRRAVSTLTSSLKPWRNWYLDLANERNIGDQRFVSIEQLKELRSLVRMLDSERLVTASHGGDLSADDVRDYVTNVQVDFVTPHRPRDNASPGQTESITRKLLQTMKELGRVVPVHFQEPFRRGYAGYPPIADDYMTDLRGALAGGAAGWCFHNGPTRGAKDELPRRSFDLRTMRLFMQFDEVELNVVGRCKDFVQF